MKRNVALLLALVLILSVFVIASKDSQTPLIVYYLDVGEGSSVVVTCDGHAMIIDGGPSTKSSMLYSFLKHHNLERLDYMVCTHPDADHCGGLSAALNYSEVGVVLCTVTSHNTNQFKDFVKYLDQKNNKIIVPNAGDKFSLGSAKVEVLAPENGKSYSDNTSIVLKLIYGNCSFLFPGDSEKEDEQMMINNGRNLNCDVLYVAHHGSASSTTQPFLDNVAPKYAIISVGDNSFGHPAEEVLERLIASSVDIYRTDRNGLITCTCDGNNYIFNCEKNQIEDNILSLEATSRVEEAPAAKSVSPLEPPPKTTTTANTRNALTYVINTNTGKFHSSDCRYVSAINDSNKWYYDGTRDDIIGMGYSPCGVCNP